MKPRKTLPKDTKKDLTPLPPPASLPTTNKWYYLWFALALALFGGAVLLAWGHQVPGWEKQVFDKINHMQLPHWVASQVAKPLSNAVWGMAGLTAIGLLIPQCTARAWRYAAAAGGAYMAVFITEHVVDRARPAGLFHDAVIRAHQDGPGFPSGHVAVLTALLLTLWPFVGWLWRGVIMLLIAAEAWSRIFLGMHVPLDVVGGFAIGLGTVAFIRILPGRLRRLLRLV
ncbi:MAG TPA: phosphatase PAP2 family protein [Nevskiaceae bacterium]|nr:phosphatase PAP2 family protein [Nevskiaceae bacterium]